MRILVLSRGGRQQTRTEDQRVNYIVCQNCWPQVNQVVRVGLVEEVTSSKGLKKGRQGATPGFGCSLGPRTQGAGSAQAPRCGQCGVFKDQQEARVTGGQRARGGVVEKEIPEVRRATSCRTYKPLHGLRPLLRNGRLGGSHWRAPHRRVMSL